MANGVSDKGGIACLLFLLLLPILGLHRFYVGKIGTGILFLLPMRITDELVAGGFTDADGNTVKLSK